MLGKEFTQTTTKKAKANFFPPCVLKMEYASQINTQKINQYNPK